MKSLVDVKSVTNFHVAYKVYKVLKIYLKIRMFQNWIKCKYIKLITISIEALIKAFRKWIGDS